MVVEVSIVNQIKFECPQCGFKFCPWVVTVPKGELHTARKTYPCKGCSGTIAKGSIYLEDRRLATQWQAGDRYHMECAKNRGFATIGETIAESMVSAPRRRIRLEE